MGFQTKNEIRLSDYVTARLLKSITTRSTEIAGLNALMNICKSGATVRSTTLVLTN